MALCPNVKLRTYPGGLKRSLIKYSNVSTYLCMLYNVRTLKYRVRNVKFTNSFHFQMSLNIGKEKDDYHHKNEDENDGISLSLSSVTLLALKEFALQRGN